VAGERQNSLAINPPRNRGNSICGLPVARRQGHHHLPAVAAARNDDQERWLLALQTALHIAPVLPQVDDLPVVQPLGLPASHSACHRAFSRAAAAADSGALSPSRPRNARSKSPSLNPCRYSSGTRADTSWVRRANSGRMRLMNRSSSLRARGRRTVIVPQPRVSLRACRSRCRSLARR